MRNTIVLVIQAPNRHGRGHQFLVANVPVQQIDPDIWGGGKSDALIISLAIAAQQTIGRFKTGTQAIACAQHYAATYQITHGVGSVELDFPLPTKKEVATSVMRHNLRACEAGLRQIEQQMQLSSIYLANLKRKITEYKIEARRTDITEGHRLHLTRVLIKDRREDLQYARNKLRRLRYAYMRISLLLASLIEPQNA